MAVQDLQSPLEVAQENLTRFRRDGYLGPIRLFTPSQCAAIIRYLRLGRVPPSPDWNKSRSTTDRFLYDLATRPHLLELLRPLLGDDIILWGTDITERDPGIVHPWHVDIETAETGHRFASIWIGLENTSRASALRLISRSHAVGATVQQVQSERGFKRGEAPEQTILEWVRESDPAAELVVPDMGDGEGLIFEGGLWHSSHNRLKAGGRTAILLQYAAAGTPVFMPDFRHLEWPFRKKKRPRPPVIAVAGQADKTVNRVVPVPHSLRPGGEPIRAQVVPVDMPLAENKKAKWQSYHAFDGWTRSAANMTCHVSVLSPGHSPHPPHAHLEEEILIVLDGDADIIIADSPDGENIHTTTISPGSLFYYPPYRHHTIRNSTTGAVTYLMFKWHGPAIETDAPLVPQLWEFGTFNGQVRDRPMRQAILFDQPTNYLHRLHAHVTDLQPGAGYPPHEDDYDVAIVVLSGEIETVGHTIGPNGVVFYPAHEPHGMFNPGKDPARYLVFEFHPGTNAPGGGRIPTDKNSGRPAFVLSQMMKWLGRRFSSRNGD